MAVLTDKKRIAALRRRLSAVASDEMHPHGHDAVLPVAAMIELLDILMADQPVEDEPKKEGKR